MGPLTRDVESLVIASRCLLSSRMAELDPTVVPIAFNEKVGYIFAYILIIKSAYWVPI